MKPDCELLRQYAREGDDAAFTEVVRRHVHLIHASAVRLLNGNAAMAQDVTQVVFTDLARKAGSLVDHTSVAGWLHTSVRFAAANAVRREQRRRLREQQASAMYDQSPDHESAWRQLLPCIDEAVGHLHEPERNAVLLRFFEEKSHREVGAALGVTENAARMRVERGLEKLRVHLARHGITATVVLLAATLSARAASAPAPAAFAASVAGKALRGAALPATASITANAAPRALWGAKAPLAFAGAAALASAAAIIFSPAHSTAMSPVRHPPGPLASMPSVSPAGVVAAAPAKLADAPDLLTAASSLVAASIKTLATTSANSTIRSLNQATQAAEKPLVVNNSDAASAGDSAAPVVSTPSVEPPAPAPAPKTASVLSNSASAIVQTPPISAAPDNNGVITQWSPRVGGNGHYYLAIAVPQGISWSDAQAYAVQRGGHLATIGSREENDFVFSLVNAPEFWRTNPAKPALLGPWLGGYHWAQATDMSYGWRWINNGGTIAYENWAQSEPGATGNCLHFFAWGASRAPTWDNEPAQGLMPGFVVEFDAKPRPKTSLAASQPQSPAPAQNPLQTVPRGTFSPVGQQRQVLAQPGPSAGPGSLFPGRRESPPIIPSRYSPPLALSILPPQAAH